MNVNIYYGGRGLVDDPTITVLNKITDVLNELRVNVEKYNLFEMKNAITTLPQTLKEADAVILASTVEWFGICFSSLMPAGCMRINQCLRSSICSL